MSTTFSTIVTAPVAPALVASALDHLALAPALLSSDPDVMLELTRRVSRTEN